MPVPLPDSFNINYDILAAHLKTAPTLPSLYQAVTDAPFDLKLEMALLHLGITVLLVVDNATHTLDRIALSDTQMAKATTQVSMKPFHGIKIPLSQQDNILIEALVTGEPVMTDDWQFMFNPELTPQQARLNQANAGIGCSVAQPLPDGKTVLIFSYFQGKDGITPSHYEFMANYASIAGDALGSKSVAVSQQ